MSAFGGFGQPGTTLNTEPNTSEHLGTPFHKMSIDEWRQVFGINMESVFFTFKSAIRHMLDQGEGGSLVVTSSLSANYGMPTGEHYAATKAGVVAITRALAVEYARNKSPRQCHFTGLDRNRHDILPI